MGGWFALEGEIDGLTKVLLLSENIRTTLCPDRVNHSNAAFATSITKKPSGRDPALLVNGDRNESGTFESDNFALCCIGRMSECLQQRI